MIYWVPPFIIEEKTRKFVERRIGRVYDITRLDSLESDLIVYRVRTVTNTGLLWYKVYLCPYCREIIGLYSEERGEWIWGRNCPHYVYVYEGREQLKRRTRCPVCGRPL